MRNIENDLVNSLLYEAAKEIVGKAVPYRSDFIISTADYEALEAAIRLIERKTQKAEKIS